MTPDEPEGRPSQYQSPGRTEKHLARTLEDVSHLFLSEESSVSRAPRGIPDDSARQSEKVMERLKRAVADLTLDNLMLKDAAKKVDELQRENELLKRAVADLTLDNLILKDGAKGKL